MTAEIQEVSEDPLSQLPKDVYQFICDLQRVAPDAFKLALESHPSLKQLLQERDKRFGDTHGGVPINQISTSDIEYLNEPRLIDLGKNDWVSVTYSADKSLLYLQALKEERCLTLEVGKKVKFMGWTHHGIPGDLC